MTNLEFTGERLIPDSNVGMDFYYEHLARYFFVSHFSKNKSVIDLGSGSGYGSYILAKYGKAQSVRGLDISKSAIDYSKFKYKLPKIKFSQQDLVLLNKKYVNKFDIATCFEVIEHLENQESLLKNIKKYLKKKGVLVISTPNLECSPGNNEYHVKELDIKQFNNLLSHYFSHVKLFSQNLHINSEINSLDLNKKNKVSIKTSEEFIKVDNKTAYIKDILPDTSQFIIAMCSDFPISEEHNISIQCKMTNYIHYYLTEEKFRENQNYIKRLEKVLVNKDEIIKNQDKLVAERDVYIRILEDRLK